MCLPIKRASPHEAGGEGDPTVSHPGRDTVCPEPRRERGLVDFPFFPSMIVCVIWVALVTQAALLPFLSSNPFFPLSLHCP